MRSAFSESKIIPFAKLAKWRESLSPEIRPLVVTNGCFDLIHPGHVKVLEAARKYGGGLLVGITCDSEVRRIKGPSRPVMTHEDRAIVVAALGCVSAVTIFNENDACAFLVAAQPDIYAKGGDYDLDTINQNERALLEKMGVKIRFTPHVEGISSRRLILRLSGPESPPPADE